MRQREGCTNFQVTLETRFRRLPRIYDGAGAASSFDVQTPGPVAGFASDAVFRHAGVRNVIAHVLLRLSGRGVATETVAVPDLL